MAKKAIVALCLILDEMGLIPEFCTLNPEDLRKAKYNEGSKDLINRLWRVLLIQSVCNAYSNHDSKDLSYHKLIMTELCSFMVHLDLQSIVLLVQQHLASLCYPRSLFYTLKHDTLNAREILLAIGWCIAKNNLFSTYLRLLIAEIDNGSLPFLHPPFNQSAPFHHLNRISPYTHASTLPQEQKNESISIVGTFHRLILFDGRYKMAIKRIQSLHRQRTLLECQLTKISRGKHTLAELFLLTHPVELAFNSKAISAWLSAHEFISSFGIVEALFWKWMTSVFCELPFETKEDLTEAISNLFSKKMNEIPHPEIKRNHIEETLNSFLDPIGVMRIENRIIEHTHAKELENVIEKLKLHMFRNANAHKDFWNEYILSRKDLSRYRYM